MPLECTFDPVTDGDRIVGVQLVSTDDPESQEFCSGMLWGLNHNSAEVILEDGEIVFKYADPDKAAEYRARPMKTDLRQLRDLFGDPEAMWRPKRAGFATPGFQYVALNRVRM